MTGHPTRTLAAVVLAAALALAGCGAAGGALLKDGFENERSGWETGQYLEGEIGYRDGSYAVTSYGGSKIMWGRFEKRRFTDVEVQVQASTISAPANNNNSFGVGCRLQDDSGGYYLQISSDGFYSIRKVEGGVTTPLVDWTPAAAINQGNTVNTLRAVCDGERLELYANGQLLGSAADGTFQSGHIALTATSFEAEPTEIHFDNITVREPGGE